MKTLLLLRHAKSSWAEPGTSDHDRPLAERGKQDAPRVGRWLQEQGLVPDLIVCSTARRASKTAKKVAKSIGYEGPIEESDTLYLAPAEQYLEYVRQLPDALGTVLVVGHNPGLEDAVEALTGRCERLSTASVAQITLEIARWRDLPASATARLVNLCRPKQLT